MEIRTVPLFRKKKRNGTEMERKRETDDGSDQGTDDGLEYNRNADGVC